jgi:hypothetical protein
MNNEELLAEAKRRYPIGTRCKSPQSGTTFIIDNHNSLKIYNNNGDIRFIGTKNYMPFIRFNGNWGEIISLPEVKELINNNYDIY